MFPLGSNTAHIAHINSGGGEEKEMREKYEGGKRRIEEKERLREESGEEAATNNKAPSHALSAVIRPRTLSLIISIAQYLSRARSMYQNISSVSSSSLHHLSTSQSLLPVIISSSPHVFLFALVSRMAKKERKGASVSC